MKMFQIKMHTQLNQVNCSLNSINITFETVKVTT